MSIGETLRDARLARGLSIRDVERLIGISDKVLRMIELGQTRHPRPATVNRLLALYAATEVREPDIPPVPLAVRRQQLRRRYPPDDGYATGMVAAAPDWLRTEVDDK